MLLIAQPCVSTLQAALQRQQQLGRRRRMGPTSRRRHREPGPRWQTWTWTTFAARGVFNEPSDGPPVRMLC